MFPYFYGMHFLCGRRLGKHIQWRTNFEKTKNSARKNTQNVKYTLMAINTKICQYIIGYAWHENNIITAVTVLCFAIDEIQNLSIVKREIMSARC